MTRNSRRQWLKSAAGFALAGTAVCGAEKKAEAKSKSRACPMGFGTYGLPGYSLADSVRLIAATGFDSIEIAAMPGYHGAPDQLSAAQRKDARKFIADSGLKLGALMGLPGPNQSKQAENTAWVEQMLELAVDLSPTNPPIIQSVLGGGEWEDKKALYRDCLGPWVGLAAKAGVELAIKPHRGHAMSRPEHAVWLIEQLDAAGKLSMVYDYSHFVFRDMPFEETVATSLPHTSYVVMKDAVQEGDKVTFKLPGETNAMPHAQILKQFYDGGYRGEVCCEISSQVWRAENYDPKIATSFCFSNMTEIFAAAGVPAGSLP